MTYPLFKPYGDTDESYDEDFHRQEVPVRESEGESIGVLRLCALAYRSGCNGCRFHVRDRNEYNFFPST